jgi:hypothetical protein
VLFWEHERLAVGLWSQCLCLVLRLCSSALVWRSSTLFVMKFFNEYIYSHGTVEICSLLNRSLQEVRDLTPIMSLTISFAIEKIQDLGTLQHNVQSLGNCWNWMHCWPHGYLSQPFYAFWNIGFIGINLHIYIYIYI